MSGWIFVFNDFILVLKKDNKKEKPSEKWAHSKNQTICLPKKSFTFIVVYHMLKWFACCYFRWNFPLHFHSLKSQLLPSSSFCLVAMETVIYSRTRSKGNKALNRNSNKGIIWREGRNCSPSSKIYSGGGGEMPAFTICPKRIII